MSSQSAEAEAIDRTPDSVVTSALNELAEDFRMAVYLADVEGFSYQEIADIQEVPIGTVMSRLHRGRAKLRQTLGEYARASKALDLIGPRRPRNLRPRREPRDERLRM